MGVGMKLLYKILLCTIIIMAVAFGLSGYLFVNFVFETALNREIAQALDDSNILQFAFETAALNVPTQYNVLQDIAVEQIGAKLERSARLSERCLRLSGEERKILYVSDGFPEDTSLLMQIPEDARTWQIIQYGGHYYIHTGIRVNALNRNLYLETLEDITEIFKERTMGFSVYRRVTLAMLLCSSAVMLIICIWLTKPIRLLTRATRKMAEGDYSYRARQISGDELGQLTNNRICGSAAVPKAGRRETFSVIELYLYGGKTFGEYVVPAAGYYCYKTGDGGFTADGSRDDIPVSGGYVFGEYGAESEGSV